MSTSFDERERPTARSTPGATATRTGLIALAVPHLEEPYFAEIS